MSIRSISRGSLYTVIRLLSLAALVFASMLAVDYYFNAHTFCANGASCQVVAESDFGQKYGKFLPALGLTAYSFFFLTSFFFAKTKAKVFGRYLSTFWIPLAIICCALGALLFIIVQSIQIHAFCYMCMGIDTSAILMVIPAVLLLLKKAEEVEADDPSNTKLHPVAWFGLYLLAAAGPLTWGSFQPPATSTQVPAYIHSFYQEGKINVVEISSFDCPHCRQLHPQLSELLKQYGDKVNFTRLTIPLSERKEACVAYLCAERQKKSEQYADCLFKDPSKDPQKLLEYARECSIDESKFNDCVNDPAMLEVVDQCRQDVRDSGFKGAPTVWIDSTPIIGYDESRGMTPYINAIEARDVSITQKLPTAFLVTLLFSFWALIGSALLSSGRRNT